MWPGGIAATLVARGAMLRPASVVAKQCERETALRDAAREAFVAPRVAVIEDDSVVRHELTQVLAGAGYHVNAVADGENGLHAVHEHQPDLLILSLGVPRLDAFESAATSARGPPDRDAAGARDDRTDLVRPPDARVRCGRR